MMLRPYNPVQDELLTRDHFEPELPGAPTAVAASNVAYELSTLDVLGARAV
jgi:hypothetical protein